MVRDVKDVLARELEVVVGAFVKVAGLADEHGSHLVGE
eukprot:CAMPEP_0185614852 /NCGR_PEP_ID=MMETSP0436-20130131/33551_1 /TAXON_ID=626734 ORGANISM="Favella taraikaensis, Strain Fe Narragansett Bay" /NCGR_SAMPLE_ID=MMETSP0436 /ASSEMBLY_ACC=CAM_ASM_000390 /LENGTH=37 /DNA_ID= /DNA_START= /DNA_END= /DNA_ORIENTATION=